MIKTEAQRNRTYIRGNPGMENTWEFVIGTLWYPSGDTSSHPISRQCRLWRHCNFQRRSGLGKHRSRAANHTAGALGLNALAAKLASSQAPPSATLRNSWAAPYGIPDANTRPSREAWVGPRAA
jgi:hypothetical protein